ncbi:MAG: hypothetical protein ACQZ2J_15680 [Pseudomonas piscis]|uniref:hypothetical protein n=1 Tax=Pseudomonas piscis TaxID=2614538 RepID=UPI003D2774A3
MVRFDVYNADGTLQMDLASRLTRVLGVVDVNIAVDGSLNNSELLNGTPWFVITIESGTFDAGGLLPTVKFSGATLTWTRNMFGVGNYPARLIYGVYSNGSN